MNGYELSRSWFDFAFENNSRVKPIHGSLYYWLTELANRMGWSKEFSNPASQCMAACGINSYNTYKKALDDLADFGFISIVRKSVNQHQACVIALSKFDKASAKALDRAIALQSTKQLESISESTDSINKQSTYNPKHQTKKQFDNAKASGSGVSLNEEYKAFIILFNELTERKFKGCVLSEKNFRARRKEGYKLEEFKNAIINCRHDKFHIESGFKHLTPEFILRQDKLEKFLNHKKSTINQIYISPKTNNPKTAYEYI